MSRTGTISEELLWSISDDFAPLLASLWTES